MLLLVSLNIVLLIILALSLFAIVFILLVLRYKIKVFKRKIEQQDQQIKIFAKENIAFKTKLDDLVNEKTKEFHEQMEINKKLIAERKIALKKANDANFLKNAFLSNMSHEIRTPLNSIMGFSDLLQTEFSEQDNSELYDFSKAISTSSERLMHLLDNLIDISRIDANDYEVFNKASNINHALQNVYEVFINNAQEKNLKYNLIPTEVPDSQLDISILERVLSLIIDNAIKYTDSGSISISSIFKKNENQFLIMIQDTGVGIDEAFISEVFAPFRQESFGYSKSHQGAGLGLPLAYKLVQLLQGKIKVKSKKMQGTQVSIYLPYIPINKDTKVQNTKNIEKRSKTSTTKLKISGKPRILVVEDDKMNRFVFKKMLGELSILTICKDGDMALQTIEETFNKNESFDIILMDINLPVPWNGIQLMKEIKNKFIQAQRIPFIAQTAYAMSEDKLKMLMEGFDDYIAKPIEKSELYHIIEQNLQNETL